MSDSSDIICTLCNTRLESPIILPCLETICEKHVNEMKTDSAEKIKCLSCKEEHKIPEDGFMRDELLEKIISDKNQIDLGKIPANKCNDLRNTIDQLRAITQDPENFLYEYFKKITNQIDIHKEIIISKIEQHYDKLLKEIQTYQENFKSKLNKNFETQNKIINDAENHLDLWQNKLEKADVTKNDFKFENFQLLQNVESSVLILAKTISEFKAELLLGNEIKITLDTDEYENKFNGTYFPEIFPKINVEKKVINLMTFNTLLYTPMHFLMYVLRL